MPIAVVEGQTVDRLRVGGVEVAIVEQFGSKKCF